ncbi:MAG: alpha/beta fold hydrolase [Gemmatimonadaceae bacterium]
MHPPLFDGFETLDVDVGETTSFARRKGRGPPVLLLHGFPETHLMWHRVAPVLAEELTVVCPDLRGYGASGKPASTADHAPYAKRAMARDLVALMRVLGFERFSICGHDRGGRVAYRLALDYPERVDRLAVLDIVPTLEAIRRTDARLALSFWPWWLLAQPLPLPERLILGDPEAVVEDAVRQWGTDASSFPSAIRAAYTNALRDPAAVHAICEEYRAAATLDVAHDAADRDAGRRIVCPTLVLWARASGLDEWYDDAGGPLGIWHAWADDVTGCAIDGGHFFPEQAHVETIAALRAFIPLA